MDMQRKSHWRIRSIDGGMCVEVVNHISPLKHVHVFVAIAIVYLFHNDRLIEGAEENCGR